MDVTDGPAPKLVTRGQVKSALGVDVGALISEREPKSEAQSPPDTDNVATPNSEIAYVVL